MFWSRADAAHDEAGGGRDDQRRDLRDQAVADREQRVGLRGRGDGHVVLEHADEQAADER